jgi:hypothetical protein
MERLDKNDRAEIALPRWWQNRAALADAWLSFAEKRAVRKAGYTVSELRITYTFTGEFVPFGHKAVAAKPVI